MKKKMRGEIADLDAKVEEGFVAGAKQADAVTLKMKGEIADLGGKVEEGFLAGAKQEDVETLKIDLGKVREDMKKEFQTINDTLGPLLSAQKTSPEATAISEDHQTPSIK